jgi:signal transduction histidine kinase/DNA-binding NarL/FixJ family response regulator
VQLFLLQDSLWFAALVAWALAAVLARGVPLPQGCPPSRAWVWIALCLAQAAAAALHLLTHDAGEPAHLLRADWIAGSLALAAALPGMFALGLNGWPARTWQAGLIAQAVAWPAAWLATGALPPLATTDILPWGTARAVLALGLALASLAAVWSRRTRPARRRHLAPAWFAIVMLAGAALAEMLALANRTRTEEVVAMRARSLAFAIDAAAANALTFDARAHESPGHRALRAQLVRLRRANPDIAYLYLAAVHEGRLVYPVSGAERYLRIVDGQSTIVGEPDEPFEPGAAVDAAFTALFRRGGPIEPEFTRDPYYGVLLTLLTPIPPPEGGPVRVMLGMDLRVQTYLAEARRARRLAQVLTLGGVLALLLFLRYQISGEAAEADRLARTEADQRERLRNEFIGMVSHELQTPVHAILAHAHTLEDKSAAAAIETHTTDLQRLVEDLLQSSALQNPTFRLHPRRCALPALLREAAGAAARQAEAKGLRFEIKLGPRLPAHVVIDALRFRQVVVNLLSNAVKYTPHGSITFSADRVDLGGPGGGPTECTLELVVADTGPGLPQEVIARLGEPFLRGAGTAGQQAGAGLGLSVTRALCAHMRGELTVGANTPQGTVFTARVRAGLPAGEVSSPAAPAMAGLVLVVEDHPTLRVHLAQQLEELGWSTHTAATAAEADEALATGIRPSVILVDQNLPDALGAECIARWRSAPTRPWLIGISASRDPAVADAMLAAGADDFLYKPVSLEALREALAQRGAARPVGVPAALAGEIAQVRAALASSAWTEAERLAHHLLNSIIALQLGETTLAHGRVLEDAIKGRDLDAAMRTLDTW